MKAKDVVKIIFAGAAATVIVVGAVAGVMWLNNQPHPVAEAIRETTVAETTVAQPEPETVEPSLRNVTAAVIDCANRIGDPGQWVVSAYAEIIQAMVEQGPEQFAVTAQQYPSCEAAVQYLFLSLEDQP